MRSFRPPKGARSTFTNPFFSRTFRLPSCVRHASTVLKNSQLRPDCFHHTQAHGEVHPVHLDDRELVFHPTISRLLQVTVMLKEQPPTTERT